MAEVQEKPLTDFAAVLDRSRTSATSRKLMKEIEQALKKVADGIQNFKDLGIKMEAAEVSLASIASSPHTGAPRSFCNLF